MATLEKIRQRSGILIIVIGFAMLAFILTDLLGSGSSILMGDAANIGKVNGEKIGIEYFNTKLEEKIEIYKNQSQDFALERVSRKQLVDATWDDLVREIILGSEYDNLGLTATTEEVYKEIINNPNIQGAEAFKDQITGQFNPSMLNQYIANMRDQSAGGDENAKEFFKQWIDFENSVKQQVITNKYNTVVSKGLYTPKALAKEDFRQKDQKVSVQYLYLPYSDIPDTEVTVTDEDIKKYYKANKNKFEQKAARNINFIQLSIAPSPEDIEATKSELLGLMADKIQVNSVTNEMDTIEGFASTDNDSLFVEMNSDIPFANRFLKKDEFPTFLDSTMWDAPVGTTFGPYENDGYMNITKIEKILNLPDSVRASHILIAHVGAERAAETITRDFATAKTLADSLFAVIEGDASKFSELNIQFSDDATSKLQGGDLKWFGTGMMTEAFETYCFQNKKGDLGLVRTNFGYHIIRIDDQAGSNRAVRIANLARSIFASETTIKNANRNAANFAGEVRKGEKAFGEIAAEMGYDAKPATNLQIFDENILGLGNSRNIIKWAFDEKTSENDINIFDVNATTIAVVQLSAVLEEGTAPLENVREEIQAKVLIEKKAEILKGRLNDAKNSGGDITTYANVVGTTLRVNNGTYSNINFAGVGNELKVTGVMHALPEGATSEPIAGELGVYILKVTSIEPFADKQFYEDDKMSITTGYRTSIPNQVFPALQKKAKVTDRRHLFF